LVFAGQFQADPSTVNNDPEHFDSGSSKSRYRTPGQRNGWWNPDGRGTLAFVGCTVQQVLYGDGTSCSDPKADQVVGMQINPTPPTVPARIVDLDSEQRGVSQPWGFTVALGQANAAPSFASNCAVAAFADLAPRGAGSGGGDAVLGAANRSVLQDVKWGDTSSSRFLKELATGTASAQLSIKFNVDSLNLQMGTPGFTRGRVVGSIGPYVAGGTKFFVAGRALPTIGNPAFNTAYSQVDGDLVTLDLGDSLPIASPSGPFADAGPLSLVLLPAGSAPVTIGPIEYTAPNWYPMTAGIVSFRLTSDQAKQAATAPLAVVPPGGLGPQALLADSYVFRLDPRETASTTYCTTPFGRRAAALKIQLGYDASIMQGQTDQGPISGPSVVGQPQSALTFPDTITTGPDGTQVLTLKAADSSNPREYIDGQVYGVIYCPAGNLPPLEGISNSSQILSVLVHSTPVSESETRNPDLENLATRG
jgi:hypothetical protein